LIFILVILCIITALFMNEVLAGGERVPPNGIWRAELD